AGRSFRAMAVEAVRVGDGTPEQAVTATRDALIVGSRVIPLQASTSAIVMGTAQPAGSTEVLHAGRMAIDYIGPAGSFSSKTYSIADVVDGRVPPVRLRGRYVLIGATAASIGDRLSSPFIHHADVQSNQHGTLMPGVEVLANAVNTILRS